MDRIIVLLFIIFILYVIINFNSKETFSVGGQKCDTSNLQERATEINNVCCNEPGNCVNGKPLTCNASCANVFLPFWNDCKDTLGTAANSFQDVVTLCQNTESQTSQEITCGEYMISKPLGTNICGINQVPKPDGMVSQDATYDIAKEPCCANKLCIIENIYGDTCQSDKNLVGTNFITNDFQSDCCISSSESNKDIKHGYWCETAKEDLNMKCRTGLTYNSGSDTHQITSGIFDECCIDPSELNIPDKMWCETAQEELNASCSQGQTYNSDMYRHPIASGNFDECCTPISGPPSPPSPPSPPEPDTPLDTNIKCKTYMNRISCTSTSTNPSCSGTILKCPDNKMVNNSRIDTSNYNENDIIDDTDIDEIIGTCCSVKKNCSDISGPLLDRIVSASCQSSDTLLGLYTDNDYSNCRCNEPVNYISENCNASRCKHGSLSDPNATRTRIINSYDKSTIGFDNSNCNCTCDDGYTGRTCDIQENIDCESEYCEHGTVSGSYTPLPDGAWMMTNLIEEYNKDKGCSCICDEGYTGSKCDISTTKSDNPLFTCDPNLEGILNASNQLCNKWKIGNYNNGKCTLDEIKLKEINNQKAINLQIPYISDDFGFGNYYENCQTLNERWNPFASNSSLESGDYCSFECPSSHTALDIYGLVSENDDVRQEIEKNEYGWDGFTVGGQDTPLEEQDTEVSCPVLYNIDFGDNENRITFTCNTEGLVSDAVIGNCRQECSSLKYDDIHGNCKFGLGGCYSTECPIIAEEDKILNTVLTIIEDEKIDHGMPNIEFEDIEDLVENILEVLYVVLKKKIQEKINEKVNTALSNVDLDKFKNNFRDKLNNKVFNVNYGAAGLFHANDDHVNTIVNEGGEFFVDFMMNSESVYLKDSQRCQIKCKRECDYYGEPCNDENSEELVPKVGYTNPFEMNIIDGKIKQCETDAKKKLSPPDGLYKNYSSIPDELKNIIISEKEEEIDEDVEDVEALAYEDYLFCNDGSLQPNFNRVPNNIYLCCPACELGLNLKSFCKLMGINYPDEADSDTWRYLSIAGELAEKLGGKETTHEAQEELDKRGLKWYDTTIEFPGVPYCWCFNLAWIDQAKEVAKLWALVELSGDVVEDLPKILKFLLNVATSDTTAGLFASSKLSPILQQHLDNIKNNGNHNSLSDINSSDIDNDVDNYITQINLYDCSNYNDSITCEDSEKYCKWTNGSCVSDIKTHIDEKITNIHKNCKKECQYLNNCSDDGSNMNLACDINCSESIDDFYSAFSKFNTTQNASNNIYYPYSNTNKDGLLYDYITNCSNTSDDEKNRLRNSYCENTYGENSINASMLYNDCLKDIDYNNLNNASNIKNFISTKCDQTSNLIYNNYKNDNCQSLQDISSNTDSLNKDSNIYAKLHYINNINNINKSCSENIYDYCCPNKDQCVNGIPLECNASCSEKLNNPDCNNFLTHLFSDDTIKSNKLKNLINKCSNPPCSESNVPNCLPDICTSALNIPHEGCMPRDCTSASNVPYEGCINLSCTDTNTPYEGCIDVSCNEALYWDCTNPQIDYKPEDHKLVDVLQESQEFINNCSNIDAQISNMDSLYKILSNGESIISPIASLTTSLGVCTDTVDKTCDLTNYDPLRRINNNCSGLSQDKLEDFNTMENYDPRKLGFVYNNSECLCNIVDYYNNCKDKVERIETEIEDLSITGESILPNEPSIVNDLTNSANAICNAYTNTIIDINNIIPRINSINALFMTDAEYHKVSTELEYEQIQTRLKEYSNYLQNKENWNDEYFKDTKQRIENCLGILENNLTQVDFINNPFCIL